MKKFLTIFSFLLTTVTAMAQMPEAITVLNPNNGQTLEKNGQGTLSGEWCGNHAGTTTQSLLSTAQSNDIEFLCLGDSLFIDHAEDDTLAIDPDATTAMGITYIFYTCQPDISGISQADILLDDCIFEYFPGELSFVLPSSTDITSDGDAYFVNDSILIQANTAIGSPGPAEFYFAPTTIDDFANGVYEGNGTTSTCIHVNDTDAFRVVYLNPIDSSNFSITDCGGTFIINGGLPEFDNSFFTDITIVNTADNSITGTVTSANVSHGGTISYTVPTNGTYLISVEDGKSCGLSFQATHSTCTTNSDLAVALDSTEVVCYGESNGTISVTPTGTEAGFDVEWFALPSNTSLGTTTIAASGTAFNITNLAAGEYRVEVEDNVTMLFADTVSIGQPDTLEITNVATVDVTCSAQGSATATVAGGVTNYTFTWSHDGALTTNSATGLAEASYIVTVTDANSCTDTASFTILDDCDPALDASYDSTSTTCHDATDGTITVTVTGTDIPFVIEWFSLPANTSIGTNMIATSGGNHVINTLGAGEYRIEIEDNDGLTRADTISVAGPDSLETDNAAVVNAGCATQGTATITTIGGTGAYIYAWAHDGALTINTATGLTAGTYYFTVTDDNLCTYQDSVVVGDDCVPNVTATYDSTSVTCYGDTDGTITATVTGTDEPFAIEWFSLATNTSLGTANIATSGGNHIINTLGAGEYRIEIEDDNGLTRADTISVAGPDSLETDNAAIANAGCATQGAATITTIGGTSAYVYAWSHDVALTTNTAISLDAGTYYFTVTDDNLCTYQDSVVVGDDCVPSVTALYDSTAVICPGDTNGTITVTVTGTDEGFIVSWYDLLNNTGVSFGNITTSGGNYVITDLHASQYHVEIEDINGLTTADTISIGSPDSLYTDNAAITNEQCNALGGVVITPTGGTGTYDYEWAHDATLTTNNATAIIAGTYYFTVTDASFCSYEDSVLVGSDCLPEVTAAYDSTAITCNGGNDGSISITVTGTDAPFSVEWFDLPIDTSMGTNSITGSGGMMSIADLTAGAYRIVITDNVGTTISDTISISEPLLAFDVDIASFTNPSCYGLEDGVVNLSFANGQAPYTILWSNNANTDPLINIGIGTYTVTVTDDNTCQDTVSITLVNPDSLYIDNIVTQDALCENIQTGTATVNTIGGTGTPSFTWSHSTTLTTNEAIGLSEGTYYVTVSDDNACEDTDSLMIGAINTVAVAIDITPISCPGLDNGSVQLTPTSNGVDAGNYSYSWSANTTASGSLANNLAADTYIFVVTDNNTGCAHQDSALIVEANAVIIDSINTSNPTCILGSPEANGIITIFASGGPIGSTYTYSIDGGISYQASNTFTNIADGTYNVFVETTSGCTSMGSIAVLTQPTIPQLVDIDTTNLTCANNGTGAVNVFVNPGSSGIANYIWSTGDEGQFLTEISGLSAGQYDVTVVDDNNCFITAGALVSQPTAIVFSSEPTIDRPCPGDNTGSIEIFVTGGAGGYSYNWDLGVSLSTGTLSNISAGTYAVSVSDANSCGPIVDTIIVEDPTIIGTTFQDIVPVLCEGDETPNCQGSANLLANGGENPALVYSFTWENGYTETNQFNSQPFSLCQGWNSVTVTDGACTVIDSVFIPSPGDIEITDFETTLPSCNKDDDGTLSISVTGGAGNYVYAWSTGDTTNNVDNIENLVAGTYSVTVTDINECPADTLTMIVPDKDSLVVDIIDTTNVSCYGDTDGALVAVASGGNTANGYTFTWSHTDSLTTSVATALDTGYYLVTATDSLGCSDTASATIVEPIPLFIFLDEIEEPACFGETTIVAVDTAIGGGGEPYFYTLDGFNYQNINRPTNAFAGTYDLTVVDASNCRVDTTIIINQPLEVLVDLGEDIEIQLGENTQLEAVPTAVFGVDSIAWTFSQYLDCVDCLRPVAQPDETTTFTITIWDANGCSGSDDIEVDIDKNRNVFLPNIFTPNGDSENDYFRPFVGAGVESINYMQVFSRWGALLYERKDFLPDVNSLGWDGTFDGEELPAGVYIYMVEVVFQDGRVLLYKGDVSLMR